MPAPANDDSAQRAANECLRKRVAMATAVLEDWLSRNDACSADGAPGREALSAAIRQWLEKQRGRDIDDPATALAEIIAHTSSTTLASLMRSVETAFARQLVAQADREVRLEASRAGHHAAHAVLRSYLDREPGVVELPSLARELGLHEAGIAIALKRLRSRFRQRVEAGLALWSKSSAARLALRRRLHSSLSQSESLS